MRRNEADVTQLPAADGPRYADLFARCGKFTLAKQTQAAGLYPYFIPISGSEGTEVVIDGERKIMLGSNNYLGLTLRASWRRPSRPPDSTDLGALAAGC